MQAFAALTRRALLAAAAAVLVAGPAAAQSLPKWRHGLVDAKADAGIYYMALHKGLFKKHGLDVEFIEFRGDLFAYRAMVAGQLESSEPSPGAPLASLEKGADFRFIASSMEGYPYALFVRKDIKSWEELKDKMFGVSSPGSTPDLIAREMLRAKGVDPRNIQIANAGGTSARIQALAGGKIDATAAASEFVAMQDKLGIKALGFANELVPMWPRFVIIAPPSVLKNRRADAVKFLAAYIEGLNYAMANREETIALGKKQAKAKGDDPTFATLFDEAKKGKYVSPTGEIPVAKIQWLADTLLNAGEIKKKLDVKTVVDDSIRQDALKLIKR